MLSVGGHPAKRERRDIYLQAFKKKRKEKKGKEEEGSEREREKERYEEKNERSLLVFFSASWPVWSRVIRT